MFWDDVIDYDAVNSLLSGGMRRPLLPEGRMDFDAARRLIHRPPVALNEAVAMQPAPPPAPAPHTLSVPDNQLGVNANAASPNWFNGIGTTLANDIMQAATQAKQPEVPPYNPNMPLNSMKPGAIVPQASGSDPNIGPVYDEAARSQFLGTGGEIGRIVPRMTSDEQWTAAASLPRNPYSALPVLDNLTPDGPINTLGVNGFRTGWSAPVLDNSGVMQRMTAQRAGERIMSDIMRNELLSQGQAGRYAVGMANADARNEFNKAREEAVQQASIARTQRMIADPKISKIVKEEAINSMPVPDHVKANLLIENQLTMVKPGGKTVIAGVDPKDLSFKDVMRAAGNVPQGQMRSYLEKMGFTPDVVRKRIPQIRGGILPQSADNREEMNFIYKLYPELAPSGNAEPLDMQFLGWGAM